MDDKLLYLWLATIKGVGARTVIVLLEKFKTPRRIWESDLKSLLSAGVFAPQANSIVASKKPDAIKKLYEELTRKKIELVCLCDDNYPDSLKNIYSPPIALFVRGKLPGKENTFFSVIGARECSSYGARTGFEISKALAENGVVIVSGMATGIDAQAHSGAIAGGGKTVAVLGCGPDVCYPKENRALMERIIENGCVLSEYPPGALPLKGNFPARNRIISGLTKGLLVVEAGERSGTLITVDYALEQGLDVFAVPGNVNSGLSKGTNSLIMQGAIMVTSAQNILDELNYQKVAPIKDIEVSYENDAALDLDEDESHLYGYITYDGADINALCIKTGYSIQTLYYILMKLEMKKLIKKSHGNMYARI